MQTGRQRPEQQDGGGRHCQLELRHATPIGSSHSSTPKGAKSAYCCTTLATPPPIGAAPSAWWASRAPAAEVHRGRTFGLTVHAWSWVATVGRLRSRVSGRMVTRALRPGHSLHGTPRRSAVLPPRCCQRPAPWHLHRRTVHAHCVQRVWQQQQRPLLLRTLLRSSAASRVHIVLRAHCRCCCRSGGAASRWSAELVWSAVDWRIWHARARPGAVGRRLHGTGAGGDHTSPTYQRPGGTTIGSARQCSAYFTLAPTQQLNTVVTRRRSAMLAAYTTLDYSPA